MKKRRTCIAILLLVITTLLATELTIAMPLSLTATPIKPIPASSAYAASIAEVPKEYFSAEKTPLPSFAVKPALVISTADTVTADGGLSAEIPAEVEALRKLIPKDLPQAEALVIPLRNRFLMWTYDLEHVMWGHYRNGFFTGTDNLGRRAWGVYGNGYFAGYYDGSFFWGKYSAGCWKARRLFGEPSTGGNYVLAPVIIPVLYAEDSPVAVTAPTSSLPYADPTGKANATNEYGPAIETMPDEVEALKQKIPNALAEAEAAIRPLMGRFLMWTRDLRHIMWGRFGHSYFVGTDNLHRHAWGLYGETVFAGMYNGDFFWGFYGSGSWRAFNLFGLAQSCGRYLTARAY